MKPYLLSSIRVKNQTVIAKVIDVKEKKENSPLIMLNKKSNDLLFKDMSDHPYQAKVILVGDGTEEIFPGGIKKGDIIHLERLYDPDRDLVNIMGEMYIKVNIHNIISVRTPEKDKSSIN